MKMHLQKSTLPISVPLEQTHHGAPSYIHQPQAAEGVVQQQQATVGRCEGLQAAAGRVSKLQRRQ